jgi:MYXO-CTERM domain-containing protein
VRFPRRSSALPLVISALLVAPGAAAFPGLMASKGKPPVVHSTHVVVMKKGPTTAVSVMPDYQGSLEPFVVLLAVPPDVTADHVVTLKREYVDHADQISAPRFHEFWEQDPCDQGPTEQEWQRNLKVSGSGFLGAPQPGFGEKKVAKELLIDTSVKVKEGEYTITILPPGSSPLSWMTGKGYKPPPGAEQALASLSSQAFIAAEVDVKRIELVGGDRAQLSPIRFFTEQPYDTLPMRLGLVNAPEKDKQEFVLYTLDPEKRYEIGNYKTVSPPTNVEVTFDVKERMGEFYNSLYDHILAKTPDAVLREFAWSHEGCGQPCATEPFSLAELLSLGGEVFERSVPDEEKNPKPPELTKEEKELDAAILKEIKKPKERRDRQKMMEDDRKKVASVKALVERHKYVLARLHYRYDDKTLTRDPKLEAASGPLEGGIALPKGQKREASAEVVAGKENKLQTRYNHFHNWKPVIKCGGPERWRWGKSPPDYRGLRKTWIADDLTRKSRTQMPAEKNLLTSIPELKLGPGFEVADAGADAADGGDAAGSGKGCGCRVAGAPERGSLGLGLAALVGLGVLARRRRA